MWRSTVRQLPYWKSSILQPLRRQINISSNTRINMNTANEPLVTYQVKDTARLIVLNRPEKLNALNTPMCKSMFDTLNEYSKSDLINLIIVKSSNSPRSLCAGGDVAQVAQNNLVGKFKDSTDTFTAEYSLNYLLATFNKPIVSIMDGITMGGGVGISIHSPFRISSEYTKWAMPEMDIGFFPDVGATFALPRILTLANSNSQMALYLCLTGDVIGGEDAYILGLASHYVSHDNLARLESRLGEINVFQRGKNADEGYSKDHNEMIYNMINDTIEEYSENRFPNGYKFKFNDDQLDVIEKCFNIDNITSVENIFHNLRTFENGSIESRKFATEVEEKLKNKSLTSMDIAIKLIQENSKDHIESALRRDLYVAGNMCHDQSGISEFSNATKYKLLDKIKTPYPWKQTKPLTKLQLNSFFSMKPSIPLNLWSNNINVTWKNYPYHLKYQLPTEQFIEEYIEKNLKGSNNLEQDTINYFLNYNRFTQDKLGIKLLCQNVIRRKFGNQSKIGF